MMHLDTSVVVVIIMIRITTITGTVVVVVGTRVVPFVIIDICVAICVGICACKCVVASMSIRIRGSRFSFRSKVIVLPNVPTRIFIVAVWKIIELDWCLYDKSKRSDIHIDITSIMSAWGLLGRASLGQATGRDNRQNSQSYNKLLHLHTFHY